MKIMKLSSLRPVINPVLTLALFAAVPFRSSAAPPPDPGCAAGGCRDQFDPPPCDQCPCPPGTATTAKLQNSRPLKPAPVPAVANPLNPAAASAPRVLPPVAAPQRGKPSNAIAWDVSS
jgi:hypothetical protein